MIYIYPDILNLYDLAKTVVQLKDFEDYYINTIHIYLYIAEAKTQVKHLTCLNSPAGSVKAAQLPSAVGTAEVGELAAALVRATFVLRRCIKSFFHCGISGRKPAEGVVAGDMISAPAPAPVPDPVPVPATSAAKCNVGRFGGSSDDIFG